ncbi:hypothetical protein DW050_11135 [Ruminococcus sp. AF42-10]|nr:hypothetical protein DW050_11135 [Ruminococcus sp. AF42-10]
MKGYKAFNKGLVCRGKQYAENTVFEEENAKNCGMHFCKNPFDVLDYYSLVDNEGNVAEFAEIEALDGGETDDGKRFYTKKMKIGTKLSLSQFIKAGFDVAIKSQAKVSDSAALTGDNDTTIIGGNRAKLIGDDDVTLIGGTYAKLIGSCDTTLIGGDNATLVGSAGATLVGGVSATLVGGVCTTLVGDNYATLVGGYDATLMGGDNAELVGGRYATLVGGDRAKLVGEYNAKLVGGNYAQLVGSSYATLAGGENAIIVGDNGSVAKGKKGAIIVLVERDDSSNIVDFKAVQVDGEKIKEDVLYQLENGEFVEVEG